MSVPEPAESARRRARVTLGIGVLAFWGVLAAAALALRLPTVDAILLAVLLAAVPAFSLAQLPLVEEVRIERLPAYWSSIVTLWLLGTACWLVGTRVSGPAAVGMVLPPVGPLLAWSAGMTLAGLAVIVAFRWIAARLGVQDGRLLYELLPRTARERQVFGALSLAAGTGEELAYRGYAIPVLAPALGTGWAVLLTTVVFGVIHGYQGLLGIVRTALMGAVLAWGFLASGSLVPVIVAHTLIDVLAGIVLGERLLSPRETPGVWTGATTTADEP